MPACLVISMDKKHRMRSEEMAHSANCHTKHKDLSSIPRTHICIKKVKYDRMCLEPIMIQD